MAESEEQEIVKEEEAPKAESEEKVVEEAADDTGQDEQENEAEEAGEGEEETPEEKPPSRRESLRIQKLISKLKEKEDGPQRERPKAGLDYKTALDADEDTLSQLEQDRKDYGDRLYTQGLEQAKSIQFQTRLEVDAPRVEAKYPVLDKESPKFNPVVADALNSMYLSTVGYDAATGRVANANVRYSDYIESIMELSDEVASEKVARSTKNIARQAAATGLRPTGGTAKKLNLNQDPSSMSDEELDAALAQLAPTKKR